MALATAFATVVLVGCGETVIKPEGAEKVVVDVVSEQTRFQPDDVECPSDVEAEVGGTFECGFTGPEGPYTAYMTITEVEGEDVEFRVVTRPSEP